MNDSLNERRNAELANQHALDARRSAFGAGFTAGGVGAVLPIAVRETPKGDRDEVFKAALNKAHDDPHGLAKADAVVIDDESKATVTDLIRKAQGNPSAIEDLERGYGGREQSNLAKAAAVENEKIDAADIDRGSLPLRKAIAEFDNWVRSLSPRAVKETCSRCRWWT